jgi:hypothetical protein
MIEDYLNLVKAEPNKIELENWYKHHGMTYEKMELYRDFIISLFQLIEETYLGDDIINNDIDIDNHFNWCFNTIISNFKKENIKFSIKGSHRDYMHVFCINSIYNEYNIEKNKLIYEFFRHLFNPLTLKKNMELSVLAEIYKMFDLNLKN